MPDAGWPQFNWGSPPQDTGWGNPYPSVEPISQKNWWEAQSTQRAQDLAREQAAADRAFQEEQARLNRALQQQRLDEQRRRWNQAWEAMSGALSGSFGGSGASNYSVPDLTLSQDLLNQIAATQQEQATAGFRSETGARNAALAGRGLRGGSFSDSPELASRQAQKTGLGQFFLGANLANKDLEKTMGEMGLTARGQDVQSRGQLLAMLGSLFSNLNISA